MIVTWLFKSNDDLSIIASRILAAIPIVFSIGALISYLRFLRMTDEMLQQIQLKGLAIGFGIGAIVGMSYPLLSRLGAPEMQLHDLIAVMMVGWGIGQLFALRTYR